MGDVTLPRASAVILAGGQSRRMGHNKAFLEFDGAPLIARVIESVRTVCAEMIIVANDAQAFGRFGVRVVGDVYPGKGSLGGVFSGLKAAHEPYALAVACDMPFLNSALLRYLISLAPQYDVVIPRARDPSGKKPRSARGDKPREGILTPRPDQPIAKERNLHPMHAVYSKNCLAPMEERLRANDFRLIGFHDAVHVHVVEVDQLDRFDPRHLSFFNVNTPDDLLVAGSLGKVE